MVIGGKNMKYKQGEKMIVEIAEVKKNSYILNRIGEVEPMEAKISRQAAEITRLLAENKKLKEDKAVLNAKIDAYELYGDQHEEEYNQAFNQGAEAAWELAKKIILYDKSSYSGEELKEIFGYAYSQTLMRNHTYSEAAAKVAEWEKAKEEIKRGDMIRNKYSTSSKFCVTDIGCDGHLYGVGRYGLTYSNKNPEDWEKTGRHIDIDGFLKQIGGEQE